MEELLARHRKELRDLQSQMTQKKKSASKKTRKSVNEECTSLERELKERQGQELLDIAGSPDGDHEKELKSNDDHTTHDDILASIAGDISLEQKTQEPSHDAQPDNASSSTKKPSRAKARLAKRAADQEAAIAQATAEAAEIPDLKSQERTRMLAEFKRRGLIEKDVAANGHCMYSAIADQMRQLGLSVDDDTTASNGTTETTGELRNDDYKPVRRRAASFIASNPDDFVPFLEEPLQDYVHKIRNTGEWGGQLELTALAKTYNLKIHVLECNGRVEEIESGLSAPLGDVWLAYYRHGFGLGEHYNSLRKTSPAAGKEKS